MQPHCILQHTISQHQSGIAVGLQTLACSLSSFRFEARIAPGLHPSPPLHYVRFFIFTWESTSRPARARLRLHAWPSCIRSWWLWRLKRKTVWEHWRRGMAMASRLSRSHAVLSGEKRSKFSIKIILKETGFRKQKTNQNSQQPNIQNSHQNSHQNLRHKFTSPENIHVKKKTKSTTHCKKTFSFFCAGPA